MMAQVAVTIAGRVYRMACDEGEEGHLEQLAAKVDQQIAQMRQSFGEIGDQRLTVMAAIALADDLQEAKRKLSLVDAEIQSVRETATQANQQAEQWSTTVATYLDQAASRIETLAHNLNGSKK